MNSVRESHSVPRMIAGSGPLFEPGGNGARPAVRLSRPKVKSQLHIRYVRPAAVAARPDLVARYEKLLTAAEYARMRGYRIEERRFEYLLSRALVRTALSHHGGIEPQRWRFSETAAGQPFVAGPEPAAAPRFSLSHTRGLIACALSDRDVGLDVEDTSRSVGYLAIAERYFAPSELADLRALEGSKRRRRFFDYWTLKEALVKALGSGIATGLSRYSFDLASQGIRATFDPSVAGDPGGWQFLLHDIGSEHLLAAAVRSAGGEPLHVEIEETVPLACRPPV